MRFATSRATFQPSLHSEPLPGSQEEADISIFMFDLPLYKVGEHQGVLTGTRSAVPATSEAEKVTDFAVPFLDLMRSITSRKAFTSQ